MTDLAGRKDRVTVQDLIDRAAIGDTIIRYATGIDRRRWPLYRSIFADEVDIDFSTWSGVAERMRADDWVERVRRGLSGFDATQHNLTNLVFAIGGTTARCVVNMIATHRLGDEFQRLGGFYTHRLERAGEGWRIAGCTLTVTWEEGDRALFARAAERFAQGQSTQ